MSAEINPEYLCPATGEECLARKGVVLFRDGVYILAAVTADAQRPRPGIQDRLLDTGVAAGLILAAECDGITECSAVNGIRTAFSEVL